MSGRCVPPAYGSLRMKTSSGPGSQRDDGGDRGGHRAEVDGDVLGLGDHPAAGVEDRRRAVAPLLDVGREGRADQRRAHLLGDRAKGVADHLQPDVHVRVTTSEPSRHPPRQPGGIQAVEPSSSTLPVAADEAMGRAKVGPGDTWAVRSATSSSGRPRSA